MSSSLVGALKAGGAFSDRDAQLILELAAQISPVKEVLARYGLTEVDLRERMEQPGFKAALKEAARAWQSDLNVQERIRLKAAALVEDNLLTLHGMLKQEATGPTAKLKAFEHLSDLAVPKKAEGPASAGTRFQLNITIPGTEKPVVVEGEAKQDVQEGDWAAGEDPAG